MQSKRLLLITLLSVSGAVISVFVGYAGAMIAAFPFGAFVSGQFLSGLHVFWLVLAAVITKTKGTSLMAGALKGWAEMLMPNHLGPIVFLISFLEGVVLEIALLVFGTRNSWLVCLAGGFSSAANVLIVQFLVVTNLPFAVYVGMYVISFCSGLFLGGYLGIKIVGGIWKILPMQGKVSNKLC